jgi:hypothetical protein
MYKILDDRMKSQLSFLPVQVKPWKGRKVSMKPTKIVSSTLLIFLLMYSITIFVDNSDAYSLPIPFSRSNGPRMSGIPTNDGGLNRGSLQSHGIGTSSDFRQNNGVSGPGELHPTISNCASSNSKLPSDSTRNCVVSNVGRPANSPSYVVTQPYNCNIPTTARHNIGQSNIVVHPNNCPNTTIVHPTNCNIPTTIRHTNSSSNTVLRSTDCPPTGTSNSLTVNNVQGTSFGRQNTNAGIYGYLYPEINQNGITPIANAGANSDVALDGSDSYDPNGGSLSFSWMQVGGNPVTLSSSSIANPEFITPIVIYPTTLTFQLIVNNGVASSIPSYVYITVQP